MDFEYPGKNRAPVERLDSFLADPVEGEGQ